MKESPVNGHHPYKLGDMKHIRLTCLVLFGIFALFVNCQEDQLEDEFESEVDGYGGRVQLSKNDLVTSLERIPESTSSSTAAGNRIRMRRLKTIKGKKQDAPYYRDGHLHQIFLLARLSSLQKSEIPQLCPTI